VPVRVDVRGADGRRRAVPVDVADRDLLRDAFVVPAPGAVVVGGACRNGTVVGLG